jgi:hypothetical protein
MKDLVLSPERTAICLFTAVLVLAAISVTGHGLQYVYGTDRFTEFVRIFNISGERSIPAWFSSIMLFCCALLLLANAENERRQDRTRYLKHWWVLAAIFLYISLDEGVEIHEVFNLPVQARFGLGGMLTNPWVFPVAGLLTVFLFAYVGFLKYLPRRTRSLFVASGALYVGGALGIEVVSTFVGFHHAESIKLRGALATLEELLEMSGTVLFIYTLQTHAIRR